MHIASVIMFFFKVVSDDGSLNRNIYCGMTDMKMLHLTVILHLYSTCCDYCDM